MEYKILRLLSFMLVPFFAILLTVITLFGIFMFSSGNIIEVAIVGTIAAILICLLTGFIGFQVTGQNAWVKAIQGETMLLMGLSSGGVGQVFSCITKNNPSGGIDLITQINKKDVVLAYDKKMAFRTLKPMTAFMHLVHPTKATETEAEEKAQTVITIPNQDFDKFAFHFGYITVLFFNFETGTLINKFSVNELEKFYAMKYLSLHLDRKLDIYIAELRQARKNFFDSLLSGISGILKHPAFPIVVIAILAFFAIVFIVMMWPQISDFASKILPHAASSTPTNTLPPGMTTGDVNAAIRKI